MKQKKLRIRKAIGTLSIFFLLSGCFGPHYERQYVDLPSNWRDQKNEESTLDNMRWWEQFHDPILNEYIFTALKNNQDLQVAISRVFQYQAHLGVVNANLYPFINGNAQYTRNQYSIAVPNLFPLGISRIQNDFELFFNLQWELDFWGRLRSASAAALAEFIEQIENRRAVATTVTTSVAKAYITLRQLDLQLYISKKTLESREESVKLAISRFQLGETSELEVTQAEAAAEIAAIKLLEFEKAVVIQENVLSILLGENPHRIKRGNSIEEFDYPISIPEGLPSNLLTRRPDIIAAEEKMIAANARVSEARALYFPQIELTGMFGNSSALLHQLLTSPAQMWQYGISAVVPVFNSGQTYYQVEEAMAVRDETLASYRQTVLNAFKEVEDALISYQKNRQLVSQHRQQVKVLKQYYHLAELRYREGEVDYLNVLDAERELFDAELDLVSAQADSFNAVADLYGALGGGWVIDADKIATGAPDWCTDEDEETDLIDL